MEKVNPMIVYNAKGQIAGRVAAKVAKSLLSGDEVAVLNTKDAVLSGNIQAHVDRMNARRKQQDKRDPEKSPKFPRVPYMMFKRMVRGMLPKKTQRGRDALHRLKAFDGPAPGIDEKSGIIVENAVKKLDKSTTLGALCAAFGFEN
jgi:large subunit ribosomal protein L13